MDVLQQLLRERKSIEAYASTSYARLNELRDLIRAERVAVDTELAKLADPQKLQEENCQLRQHLEALQPQLEQLRHERDSACAEVVKLRQQRQASQDEGAAAQTQVLRLEAEREGWQKQLERGRLECELAQSEAAQAVHQVDEGRSRATALTAVLQQLEEQVRRQEESSRAEIQQLKQECSRLTEALQGAQQREKGLQERLNKVGDVPREREELLRERRELAEKLQLVDQIEAELRQQQATTQKDPGQAAKGQPPATKAPGSSSIMKHTVPAPVPAGDSAVITFPCTGCAREIKVPAQRASRLSKCPHCSKMVLVPKR